MINVTGGFLITDRMLKMFRKKEAIKTEEHK
jgi:NAD/NADP transhydrogenase alpha subunit